MHAAFASSALYWLQSILRANFEELSTPCTDGSEYGIIICDLTCLDFHCESEMHRSQFSPTKIYFFLPNLANGEFYFDIFLGFSPDCMFFNSKDASLFNRHILQ